jgi:outer membrane protein, heavy metal efflux system
MKNKYLALISAILFISMHQAGYAAIVSENEVLTSVRTHFPLILAAKDNIQKAKADYLSAQGAFDPLIRSNVLISPNGTYQYTNFGADVVVPIEDSGNKVFTGYRIGRGTYPPYDQNLETYNYGEFRVGVELPMLRDSNVDIRRTKIKQAGINEKISNEDYRLARLKAEYDAALSYWEWYTTGKQLIFQRHILALAQQRQKALDKSVNAGDLAEIDAVDNKRMIAQRESMVRMNEAMFTKAAQVLSLYYRDASGDPIVLKEKDIPASSQVQKWRINQSEIETTLSNIVNSHPRMKLYQQQYSNALVSLKQANNDLLPKINNRFYIAQDMGGGNPPLNRTSINYELTFELPINQREAKGQMASAENQIQKIDQEKRLEAESIVVNIKKSLIELRAAREVIQLTRKEVDMTVRVEDAEAKRYQHGDSNLFLLNQRELMTVEAETRYFDAIRRYYNSVATLRYSLASTDDFSRKA